MNKEHAFLLIGFIAALIVILLFTSTYAQIGQAPVGGHQIGGPVSTPHEAASRQSPVMSADRGVETFQGYTALPQALLTGQKTADQMTPDERLRSAVEFCEMDFAKSPDYSSNPDCAKVMKVWAESGARERYEQEVAAWRASQLDREKQIISRVAGETK